MYHMLLQNFQKVLTIDWAFNNIVSNDAIKGHGRDNGISGFMHKTPLDLEA